MMKSEIENSYIVRKSLSATGAIQAAKPTWTLQSKVWKKVMSTSSANDYASPVVDIDKQKERTIAKTIHLNLIVSTYFG